MSCSCTDINCDPCAFCLPPGVTNLPNCNPKSKCNPKIDVRCVIFSGPTHLCSTITHGENLQDLLLFLLAAYFINQNCCALAGNANVVTTTTSTTTTTTTTTTIPPTTTTTTSNIVCNCYKLENFTDGPLGYSFIDCLKPGEESSSIVAPGQNGATAVYRCSRSDGFAPAPGLIVSIPNLCSVGCGPAAPTTTTTTINPKQNGIWTTIKHPIIPSPNLVIQYINVAGTVVVETIVAGNRSTDWTGCIKCSTTVTVISGTLNGPIIYDPTGNINCNCN